LEQYGNNNNNQNKHQSKLSIQSSIDTDHLKSSSHERNSSHDFKNNNQKVQSSLKQQKGKEEKKSNNIEHEYVEADDFVLINYNSNNATKRYSEDTSTDQFEKFFNELDSNNGKLFEKKFESIFSDEEFKKLGIDPQDYNPNKYPEEMVRKARRELMKKRQTTIHPNKFKAFKASVRRDFNKEMPPGMENLLTEDTNQSMDEVLNELHSSAHKTGPKQNVIDEYKEINKYIEEKMIKNKK
jgi:hypothetical protein